MDEEATGPADTLCRTCLSNLKPDETFDLFLVPGLAKKLCVCTSLPVEQQDGYPRNLCSTCYSRLDELHDFQKQCMNSVQKFKELMTQSCFIIRTLPDEGISAGQEEEQTSFDPLLNTKVEIDNEEDVLKRIEDVDKDTEDVEHLDDSGRNSIKEDVDDSNSDDEKPLKRLRSSKRVAKTKTKQSDKQADLETFDPLLGAKDLSNTQDILKRIEEVDKESEEDNNVDDTFNDSDSDFNQDDVEYRDSDEDTLGTKSKKNEPKEKTKRKRMRIVPAPADNQLPRIIKCHICQQKFKKTACYEEHMKCHSDQLPYQCEAKDCQRGFTTTTGLKHHMEHTHPELCNLHPCSVEGCGESFAQTRMLTKHLRQIHNIAKPIIHPCSKCEKKFRCPMALKKHMYDHTGEELPFVCRVCQKRFRVNTELRDHLLRHAGIKKFVCFHCGVGRTTKQELDKHMLIHTTEKKFKCDHCEHTSHNKQRMNKHIKAVHMKIRDFVCQYCPKTFASSCACKNHEKLHTGDDCFECVICGRKFLFESRLIKHLRSHAHRTLKTAENKSKQENEQEEVKKTPDDPADVPVKPKDPRRVEVVDISQLAGTSVNPIPLVSVSSWATPEDYVKNEGQLNCADCGKNFTTLGALKSHIKAVHDKIRDYACRFCPKRFSKTYTLKHHEYTHTGEKPYECPICSQRYRHDATFRKHMESHNRPPKEPKEPKKPKRQPQYPPEPRVRLNTEPQKNYEQYEDPDAERAAATAQLLAQQQDESEAKRKAEAKARVIQEAACEQLQQLHQLPVPYESVPKQTS